ncbi:MAG TPA: ROK family transcriptional regulator [Acidimicrobiales bacterium]|nr:ROK family transcriptional regulator [Acidimicrobiales bacterium]
MPRSQTMGPNSGLLSPRRIGDLNRARVLRALSAHGPLSRADLAKEAGVTRATMGTIVQTLIDGGILEERAPLALGAIGKPARPVWFARGAATAVAASITMHGVDACLVDFSGTVRERHTEALKDRDSATSVARAVADAVARVRMRTNDVVGVGVAVPATCDTEHGEVLGSGQIPGARGHTIAERVAARTSLPVHIDNDSRAHALAEKWFGAGRGLDTYAALQTGEGLSAGIVLDGEIVRSRMGIAGEIGHTAVVPDGERCTCGLRGCWETIATLRWLRREARARGLRGANHLTCARLATLAETDDDAAALLDTYAANLAIGIANLNQTLSLEVFILHGDALGGGEAFRARLERYARRRSLSRLSIVNSTLGDEVSLLGAGALVLAETFRMVA